MSLTDARKAWAMEGRRLQRIADEERAMAKFNIDLPPAMKIIQGEINYYDYQEQTRGWFRRLMGL